jgi:hypothetical protein
MNPKEYYYHRFREQLTKFIQKSNAHRHNDEGIYISIQEINKEKLSHIPQNDYMLFHCALACTVLIDQVMYSHFKDDYQNFQNMTHYPKIEYGITSINARPWDITHSGIGLTTLEHFLVFFVKDLKEFFSKHQFKVADWEKVRFAMLSDEDCVVGSREALMKKALENNE